MAKVAKPKKNELIDLLIQTNYLFRGMDRSTLANYLLPSSFGVEKLYSNRPIYTAFRPRTFLNHLYLIAHGGPVVIRSAPLDRIIGMTYPGACFGMRNLPVGYGLICKAFPSLVEAYKTTDVIKINLEAVQKLYAENEEFQQRYNLLFELRQKFEYHLLNCSTYPPQAVAALLRALIYQERELGNQPNSEGTYTFDLPIDVIARASQLNHRTVEQVIKGMQKVGLLAPASHKDPSDDTISVIDSEGLKEVYSATRDKVSWWPLRG